MNAVCHKNSVLVCRGGGVPALLALHLTCFDHTRAGGRRAGTGGSTKEEQAKDD